MPLSSCTINSWSEQAEALTDLFAAGSCCFTPPRFADLGQLRFEVSQRALLGCSCDNHEAPAVITSSKNSMTTRHTFVFNGCTT